VVKRLEQRGFVERRPAEDDRRITVATITDSGYEFLVAAAPGHVATVREYVVDVLSPEQLAQLKDIADTILAKVDPGKDC
jgi:DNA-binding MarR family transcriptional regulator